MNTTTRVRVTCTKCPQAPWLTSTYGEDPVLPVTAEEAVEVQERLVALEVLLKEVLRRLDSEVTPRHSDHEARLRLTEIAVTEMRVRVTLMASAVGTASGVLAGVASAFIVRLTGG